MNKGQTTAADVAALLRARNPLIWITSKEEARVERLLLEAAQAASYEPRFWDCATGVSRLDGLPVDASVTDPAQALVNKRPTWLSSWQLNVSMPHGFRSSTSMISLKLSPSPQRRAASTSNLQHQFRPFPHPPSSWRSDHALPYST